MPWRSSSARLSPLPPFWRTLRVKVFERDGHRCTATDAVTGERCIAPAEECDHIGRHDDHSMENLRSLCRWHHSQHTAAQAVAAREARLAAANAKFRRTEQHPGMLA